MAYICIYICVIFVCVSYSCRYIVLCNMFDPYFVGAIPTKLNPLATQFSEASSQIRLTHGAPARPRYNCSRPTR